MCIYCGRLNAIHRPGDVPDLSGSFIDQAFSKFTVGSFAVPTLPKPIFTPDQIIKQLDSSFHWTGQNLTYAFPTTAAGWIPYSEAAGFSPLTAAQIAVARSVIQLWDDLIAPNFSETTNLSQANIKFSNTTTMVDYAHTYRPGTVSYAGSVWFNTKYGSSSGTNNLLTPQSGQWGFSTFIHEIGHALGLSHPGPYNATYNANGDLLPLTYGKDAVYAQDSLQYSIMSYFGSYNTGANWKASDGNYYSPQTPMLDDVNAIQSIYGQSKTTRNGNSVYGFNASSINSTLYDFTINKHPVLCIYDSGGIDTLDLSGWNTPSRINLNPGNFSDCDGMTFNISIAYSCWIENAKGGGGNDTITGNDLDNYLSGFAGADYLEGGAGNDTLVGGAGNDYLVGGDGNDSIQGDLGGVIGNDTLYGGAGDDYLNGDFGIDVLDGGSGNDTLWGGWGNDTLFGGAGNDFLSGDIGDDTYVWSRGDGSDIISEIGGLNSFDTLFLFGVSAFQISVKYSTYRITLGIAPSYVSGTDGGSVTVDADLDGIEKIVLADAIWTSTQLAAMALAQAGSIGNDSIIGFRTNDIIDSGAGNDFIDGRGGDDTLRGGSGNDRLVGGYGNDTFVWSYGDGSDVIGESANMGSNDILVLEGVNVAKVNLVCTYNSLILTIAPSFVGGNDGGSLTIDNFSLTTIETIKFDGGIVWTSADIIARCLRATAGNDSIYGFSANDSIDGGAGNDFIDGRGGDDTLRGGSGNDTLFGGDGSDTYIWSAGDGNDEIWESTSSNYDLADTLILKGVVAARVSLNFSGTDVVVLIAPSIVGGTDGGRLILRKFDERGVDIIAFDDGSTWNFKDITAKLFVSTSGADSIVGFSSNDMIDGGAGNDTIYGLNGNDTLYGGSGNDSLGGDNGNDLLIGGAGDDTLIGAGGNDTYIWSRGDGADLINEWGGYGSSDSLILKGVSSSFVSLGYANQGLTLVIAPSMVGGADGGSVRLISFVPTGVETIIFDNTTWATADLAPKIFALQKTNGDDSIYGFDSNDLIDGGDGNDYILGYGGDDTIYGSVGNDFLYGFDGNDSIDGGDGNDYISGMDGIDTLYGGLGNDLFTYNNIGCGQDIILDFNPIAGGNHDVLSIWRGLATDFNALMAKTKQAGTDLTITFSATDSIILKNVAIGNFTADDVQFI
ncbi:M10 family metallopeptidase C-terminal domain-containing protein [Rhizobiales bacterium TNE-4]|nr:M10 family metallopeptidase C-terminal domain-containing protein [Rhizobiales bacterium TNE-4]MBV1827122.1 M10 family metallopeptidase C-terminal domain-containing protein [Rhizobiales bacterium TNE-4]